MKLSALCLAACLGSAIALSALPASAQSFPAAQSSPSAGALTPAQGAAQGLDRAHQAKDLAEMNSCVTRQTAAILGLGLVLVGNSSGLGRAFQDKVAALMSRYSLTRKLLDVADESNTLPPGLAPHGHQFLADALILKEDYEKNPAPGKSKVFADKFIGSALPASKDCTFRVLSPTRVKIVPRSDPHSPLEVHLEDGQWRIDVNLQDQDASDPSEPKLQTITPRAAAFLKAITKNNASAVAQMLKANPELANTPPAYLKGHSGSVSDLPLSEAANRHNLQIATLLLKADAKVNAENYFEETALDEAAFFSHADMVALLLTHGANIAHRNTFGETALHQAVQGNNPGVVAVLLARGADVNARDDEGKTPLAVALTYYGTDTDHATVLKLLRQHGAKK